MVSALLFITSAIVILSIPLSAIQLIASGVLVVAGTYNILLRTHLTYTMTNPETGQIYCGRTSGFGEPAKILKRRMYRHLYLKKGFINPTIDVAIQHSSAYQTIRGREQPLIDFHGGIGHPKVANVRRGVSKGNFRGKRMNYLSTKYFGYLADYTGK